MGSARKRLRPPRFRRSLTITIAAMVALALAVMLALLGVFVSDQLRTQLFNARKEVVLEDAAVRVTQVQNALDQATVSSVDQVQDVVSRLMVSTRDSAAGAGAIAVMLLHTAESSDTFVINEYLNRDLLPLITPALKTQVNTSGGGWQSVGIPDSGTSAVVPGIAVGALVDIPLAGPHQLYLLYSLESEQQTIGMVLGFLALASIPLVVLMTVATFLLVYRMTSPVRTIAQAATKLSQGNLSTRVDIHGQHEIAQLGTTFNDMAASLQQQITEYDVLSQLQQRFVSDVSHELRTPLTTIAMAEDVIYSNRADLPASANRSAELLHSEVGRLEQMLADLLEISRYDAQKTRIETESTDIYGLVEKAIGEVSELADHLHVPVVLGERPADPRADVDPKRVQRVVRNLLVNAYEYSEQQTVNVQVATSDDAVAIAVIDHGVGMDDDTQARVFDRFFRADPSRTRATGGTGLGLAISHEDIVAHAGTIEVFGELGVGSVFVVTLPRRQDQPIVNFPFQEATWFDKH